MLKGFSCPGRNYRTAARTALASIKTAAAPFWNGRKNTARHALSEMDSVPPVRGGVRFIKATQRHSGENNANT